MPLGMLYGAVPMIKHKRLIKHKELFPWEKHRPGTSKKRMDPESYDDKEYRAHIDAESFAWMVLWGIIEKTEFDITETINYWWSRAYTKEFPKEGGTLQDLTERIFTRLIDRGHDSKEIDPKESDYKLPSFLRDNCSNWKSAKDRFIHKLNQEVLMAKIKIKKTGKDPLPEKLDKKTKTNKEPVKSSPEAPKWVTSSRPDTKAHNSKLRVCELLLEREHSDSEISLMVDSELDYKLTEDRINFYRKTLNLGRFAPLGFERPDEPVEEILKGSSKKVDSKDSKGSKKSEKNVPIKKFKVKLKKK